jgi:hypothetical protein
VWLRAYACTAAVHLKHEQVLEDAVWSQQDEPFTVHAFLQPEPALLEPSRKRPCNEGEGSAVAPGHRSSCLVFYVRMADHPGKFDIEAAKSFALVPKKHYAALKRGETVVGGESQGAGALALFTLVAEDGVEVRASQVVGAPIPGKSFAIVDHDGCTSPNFGDSACARALDLLPDTVLHCSTAMTPQIEGAIQHCGSAVHVGVWGAAVEMSSMCAGEESARNHAMAAIDFGWMQVML